MAQPRAVAGQEVVLEAKHLVKTFGAFTAVEDVSLKLYAGETLGIVGESGSGKTTTARLLLDLERPDSGTVDVDGTAWSRIDAGAPRALRRRIQVVYQDPLSSFDPRYPVHRIVAEPLAVTGLPRAGRRDRGASHGASRIFRLSYPDPVHIGLAREARELWRELEDQTGTRLLTVTGGVDHGDHPYLKELADGLAVGGVPHEWLTPLEAAERWPGIRFDTRALFHPDSGRGPPCHFAPI